MEELEAEMRGRQMAVETVLFTVLAHIAANTTNPVTFIAQIMGDAEQSLNKAAEHGANADERKTLDYSLAAFKSFSDNMLAHVTKIMPTSGKQ